MYEAAGAADAGERWVLHARFAICSWRCAFICVSRALFCSLGIPLVLFDFATQRWEQLAQMDSVGHLAWSRRGEFLYVDAAAKDGVSIYRVGARDHRLERFTTIPPPIGLAFGLFGPWTGLDPDDSPLSMRDTSVQEIYALDLQLP